MLGAFLAEGQKGCQPAKSRCLVGGGRLDVHLQRLVFLLRCRHLYVVLF